MSEPVIILRGLPRFSDHADLSPEMLEDLGAVAELTEEQLTALHRRLSAVTGFLDPKRLVEIVRESVSDDRTALAVQRTLRNLGPDDVNEFLQSLAEHAKQEGSRLKEQTLDKLRQTLPKLVTDVPALWRFEKAERLARLTGQALESVDLICDLRPIFDDARKHIEGMMPYTRLHLSVTGDDGLPRAFEAELTAEQVHELADKVKKAMEKLAILRSKVNEWLPEGLPNLPLTRVPRKGSSNVS